MDSSLVGVLHGFGFDVVIVVSSHVVVVVLPIPAVLVVVVVVPQLFDLQSLEVVGDWLVVVINGRPGLTTQARFFCII